ncbi:MAG: hypothetical protein FD138_1182, partial [Planctomycetota bacterium]
MIPLSSACLSRSSTEPVRPIEDHVFDVAEQFFVDLLVHRELPGVDDAHVEAGLNRVEQEHRVDRLTHDIVAAKRERHVAHAAGGLRAGARDFDPPHGLKELDGVVRVLVHPRADGEDVRIEDDVFRQETDLFGQQLERSLTDRDFVVGGHRLAGLVEGHDDH